MSEEAKLDLALKGMKLLAGVIGGPLGWATWGAATFMDFATKEEARLEATQKALDEANSR